MLKKWIINDYPAEGKYAKRRIYVYLPDSYSKEPDHYYPVLYMFDGHNVFLDRDATYGKSWGMKRYMQHSKKQLIIVAVECNHSPDHGRLREYSPFDFDDPSFGSFKGEGHQTMEWFVNELKPYIDDNFRTIRDREHTFIAGSSMGGLMSVYAICAYNHVFSGAACLSPSVWANSKAIQQMIKDTEFGPNTVVFLDYGENELANHKKMLKLFRKVTDLFLSRKVLVTSRILPNGDHCEACWEKEIPYFMNTLLYLLENK